jgi:hypothetical protein
LNFVHASIQEFFSDNFCRLQAEFRIAFWLLFVLHTSHIGLWRAGGASWKGLLFVLEVLGIQAFRPPPEIVTKFLWRFQKNLIFATR